MERRKFIQITGSTGAVFLLSPSVLLNTYVQQSQSSLEKSFTNPVKEDGPWVVWHWTNANQTKEGITSNLEGMAKVGIAGATLFSFPPSANGTVVENAAAPLTPEWFGLIEHAVSEADRLGITLAIQISAGWATAGGSWIPPELSQQQIVWSETTIEGGKKFKGILARPKRETVVGPAGGRGQETIPETWENYYRELAVLAFPVPVDWEETNITRNAKVITNLPVTDLSKLTDISNTTNVINTDKAGWIQFAFEQPFTLRSIFMNPGGFNRPAHSMEVQASDDGTTFRKIGALEPMMNSWQTRLSALTHTVPQTTARYFRLVYNPVPPIGYDEHMQGGSYRGTASGRGAPPAGVSPTGVATPRPQIAVSQTPVPVVNMLDTIDKISITSVGLSSTTRVHHYQGKTALVWGRSRRITREEMPDEACLPMDKVIDLTDKLKADGTLDNWQPPAGKWRIMRFGYTTMARTNGSGIGQGLEADKFSVDGARIAFEGWYGKILQHIGPRLSGNVVKMLNVDSWECGSQNWSPVFRDEFRTRRGYDVIKYLPLMAGIPLENADITEGFLFDVRRTIGDLISDNFFGTLNKLAHAQGSKVQTEAVCPTMMSDDMMVHRNVDVTAGEFWVRAWQNWKPCDIKGAASGAHIYGKQIAMAEAFTGGGTWTETPYALKAMGDMHFVEGINRFMIHLWAAQPFPNRLPGVTGAAGTYFNEHTTWHKPGKAWIDYIKRCQSLLQSGKTVSDALYFIGEEVPCRALIPPKYGTYYVTDPPLPDGYAYDSINQDALLNLTKVEDGRIVLDSGVSYSVLVLRPETLITLAVAQKIKELVKAGVTVVGPKPSGTPSLEKLVIVNSEISSIAHEVWCNLNGSSITENIYGKGRVFWGKPMDEVLAAIGVKPDVQFLNEVETETGKSFKATAFEPHGINPTLPGDERKGWGMMWNHRQDNECDYYFLSNQEQLRLSMEVSFRISDRIPELWHPDTGQIEDAPVWREENGRTIIPYEFDSVGSVFVMFRKPSSSIDNVVEVIGGNERGGSKLKLKATESGLERWAMGNGQWTLKTKSGKSIQVNAGSVPAPENIEGDWDVTFPLLTGVKKQVKLKPVSWFDLKDEDIKYFSGTATYVKEVSFTADQLEAGHKLYLDLGDIRDLARVHINGKDLGIVWKPPYKVDITSVVVSGVNRIIIEVTNTWKNRLTKDAELPAAERQTWVAGGSPGADSGFLPAGLLGPVQLIREVKI